MVKHTQTIRRVLSTNYLSEFNDFQRLALKAQLYLYLLNHNLLSHQAWSID